ncbi:hypothetical protein TanjilG_19837 [Lupinus angustifolius]|uniref:non-specific serine/threonine protein kinase n=1 Tax=Lupinus angustifolius TaxID=3871 RepID=A0A1J7GK89_LUPAN|nr:PREDICTED: CBL-interacting serine/threonine-protein kinase 14-like [Lupinus angustifolius]OIW00896.1 hypothetical protein TanjilG_19837 [Lupinus angustifolius]
MYVAENDAVAGEEEVLIPCIDKTTETKDKTPFGVVLLGKYELLKLLGSGAFAKVYQALNVETGKSVAVKAVSKKKVLKNGYTAQIEREISIMRRLRHPHIAKLFEVLATKTKIYLIMEFVPGGDLYQKVADEGRLTENLSRQYFRQLISAMKYFHSHGVFHRDLKLDNLLIDENMNIKVSDFGLSAVNKQIRLDGFLHTTCGTPAYLAPEILSKRGYDGARIDVWSCGVVLFALHAGYLPFNGYSYAVMYRKIFRGMFRFPKWTSCELRNLITRMLDTNPNTRITVDEIMIDPWFTHGGFVDPVIGFEPESDKYTARVKELNAFDLISFASGLDISGLFMDPSDSGFVERLLCMERVERIVEKVEEVAEIERVVAKREENGCGGVRLEGSDGNFVVLVGVYRLTVDFVVIEVKSGERGVESGARFWRDKLRPMLIGLAEK